MAKPITPEEMTAYVEATWNKCQEEAWQEQEPVGYAHVEDLKREHHDFYVNRQRGINEVPLYTAPSKREWVGLTDDEIKEIVGPWGDTPIKGYTRKLFDQIEAKLREKNQ